MNLQPTQDRVIVRPERALEKSKGGIFIPSQAQERPQLGTVIAVGPGKVQDGGRIPMEVMIGDTILYAKYTGSEIKEGEEDYIIMHESDIIAIKRPTE